MKIICVGDSLTYGYPFGEKDSWTGIISGKKGWEMVNLGVNGESSGEILQRVRKHEYFKDGGSKIGSENKADKVTIMCGSNDFVYDLGGVNDVLANTLQMVLMAKDEGIRPVVMIPALCEPAQAREAWMDGLGVDYEKVNSQLLALGKELKAAKDRFDFELIDIQTGYEKYHKYVDGLHPTKEGYELIAQIVKEEL